MVLDILKRDLKRKKTMNTILLLFIILATIFVSSSVDNIIAVMNGTDYYFDKAKLGNYVVLTMGQNSVGALDEILENEDNIEDYRLEDVVYSSKEHIEAKGENLKLKNVALLQSLEDTELNFFNEDNEIVDKVEKGKVYLTSTTMEKNDLKEGDKVEIHAGDVALTLEIAGRLKDAFLGSSMMGNTRFLLSREDYELLEKDPLLNEFYRGQVCYMDVKNVKQMDHILGEADKIAFSGDRGMLKMCYVIDMIIAGILLVVSLCLIIISFVVLKFTITFTLTEEFREIGVMKAIGISNWKIRSIYATKYFVIAIVGCLIGFAGSIPLSDELIKMVSDNIVLGNDAGIIVNILSVIVVICVVLGYAIFCTRKVKNYSPIDAIRSGQTGERFNKKSVYRLGKSHMKNSGYMALNDVISSPKRYMTIIVAFFICASLVLMIANTTETMQSENLVTTFGKQSDVYLTDNARTMESMSGQGKDKMLDTLDELEKILAENGINAKACVDVQYKYKVAFDGKTYKISCQQGINTKTADYEYYKGTVPQNKNEIAITEIVAKKIGAKIGDTVRITINDKADDYVITAYFQSMNLMGEVIRLHEDVETNMSESSSAMAFQFDYEDEPDKEEQAKRIEKIKDIFETDEVFDAAGYSEDCIGVVGVMEGVKYLLIGITIIVTILVTILMERSFISEEKGEIAILKAIGFKDSSIIAWHLKRFGIVTLAAVLAAMVLSIPLTHLCITPIFKMMGMVHLNYSIDYLEGFVILPAIVLSVTLVSAFLTSLCIGKISSRDTASIE